MADLDLSADRDAWKARAEKAEAHIAECNQTVIWHTCCPEDARRLSQMRESDERAEMAESRATQAEADYAACAAAIGVEYQQSMGPSYPGPVDAVVEHIRAAIADRDSFRNRADQAEAQAAAMVDRANKWLAMGCQTDRCFCCSAIAKVKAIPEEDDLTAAGRTLLAELEALRALDRMLRGTWTAEERVAALAAVDAARKGET